MALGSRVSAGIESDRADKGGPFGAMWPGGTAVEHVGGDVRDLVAEGLEESLA
jgi:hypothetical protein